MNNQAIQGVNLGGWLVLEKWMTPELYTGSDAPDEYHLLTDKKERSWLHTHRHTFITKDDFTWLKAHGIKTVRLPVGWWLFDADPPYVSAEETFFNALSWARDLDMTVVLDVHAAPGCQNGFDNGGLQGVIDWPNGDNVNKTLRFITTLVEKTKDWQCVIGLELLNEPFKTVDLELIQTFYKDAINIVRAIKGPDYLIIVHDGFRLFAWEHFFQALNDPSVFLDTHMYHVFGELPTDASFDAIHALYEKRLTAITQVQKSVPVIIGEWSAPLLRDSEKTLHDTAHAAKRQQLFDMQRHIFNQAAGWFFWNYTLSKESLKTHPGWSYRHLVESAKALKKG